MKLSRILVAVGAIALAASLTACSSSGSPASTPASTSSGSGVVGGDVIAPVVMDVNALQGATVELVVGQVLDIDTGDLPVDSYTAKVDDPSIVEFDQGRIESTSEFNPGLTALAEGSTKVVMTNAQGGIQPLSFTVEVSGKK